MHYGDGDHQTADQDCNVCLVAGQSPWELGLRPIGLYASSVCDTKSAIAAAVFGLWRYTSDAFAFPCHSNKTPLNQAVNISLSLHIVWLPFSQQHCSEWRQIHDLDCQKSSLPALRHTHTHTHARTHARTHAHTHTHTQTFALFSKTMLHDDCKWRSINKVVEKNMIQSKIFKPKLTDTIKYDASKFPLKKILTQLNFITRSMSKRQIKPICINCVGLRLIAKGN